MADLTITDTTYGRSTKGINALKNDILADIKIAKDRLNSDEYNNFIKEIKKYWVGADADKFIANFKSSVNSIRNGFASWEKTIIAKFDEDRTQFEKFQSGNDILN